MALTARLCIILDFLVVTCRLWDLQPKILVVKRVNFANYFVNLSLSILILGHTELLKTIQREGQRQERREGLVEIRPTNGVNLHYTHSRGTSFPFSSSVLAACGAKDLLPGMTFSSLLRGLASEFSRPCSAT
jgi:hypothetical protein